jgi:hypothetical protein
MIGRKTKGGRVMTSSPPRPEFDVSTSGEGLGDGVGDACAEGDAAGEGEGEAGGVGVGGPCRVKVAQGLGWTLAQILWVPGRSPGKAVTDLVNPPEESAVTEPATRSAVSQ